MEKYTIGELLRYVVKRWWIVVIGIVFFAALLGIPKMQKAETEEATYQYSYSQLVKFNNHATYEDADNKSLRYQNYNDIWFRNSALSDFVKTISDNYDMAEIEATWNEMGNAQRADWVRSVFSTASLPNTPNYEVALTVTVQEENKAYVESHLNSLFQDFLQYMEHSVKIYEQDTAEAQASMELLNSMQSSVVNQPQDEEEQNAIDLKYFVVGGVLGLLVGVFLICILFLTDKRVVSKSMFVKAYDVDVIDKAQQPAYDIFCYMLLQAERTGKHSLALCSTMQDVELGRKVAEEFKKAGLSLKLNDWTQKASESIGPLYHNADELETCRGDNEYQLVLAEVPSRDAGVLQLLLHCACSIFVERLGKSQNAALKDSIEKLQKNGQDTGICIVWQ